MGWRQKGRPEGSGLQWGWDRWRGGKRSWRGLYRYPRTTQERRLWDEEYGRGCRSQHRLIDAYDEVFRTVQRSWKEQRNTQYKVKDGIKKYR